MTERAEYQFPVILSNLMRVGRCNKPLFMTHFSARYRSRMLDAGGYSGERRYCSTARESIQSHASGRLGCATVAGLASDLCGSNRHLGPMDLMECYKLLGSARVDSGTHMALLGLNFQFSTKPLISISTPHQGSRGKTAFKDQKRTATPIQVDGKPRTALMTRSVSRAQGGLMLQWRDQDETINDRRNGVGYARMFEAW